MDLDSLVQQVAEARAAALAAAAAYKALLEAHPAVQEAEKARTAANKAQKDAEEALRNEAEKIRAETGRADLHPAIGWRLHTAWQYDPAEAWEVAYHNAPFTLDLNTTLFDQVLDITDGKLGGLEVLRVETYKATISTKLGAAE